MTRQVKRIAYLIHDEVYSGIIDSQAIDVARFFDLQSDVQCCVIAGLPFRNFKKSRKTFRANYNGALFTHLAIPQRLSTYSEGLESIYLACKFRAQKLDLVIARGPIAATLAIKAKSLLGRSRQPIIVYDGRGANKAEDEEYNIVPDFLKSHVIHAELTAVTKSDGKIAVTQELAEWWESQFPHTSSPTFIIPTTLPMSMQSFDPAIHRTKRRNELGYSDSDIVLAYAGGTAGWQDFHVWLPQISKVLSENSHFHLLLLTKPTVEISKIQKLHSKQVKRLFLPHYEVMSYLSAADFGILWRRDSVTNQVASPTKLSEYLACDLSVIAGINQAVSKTITRNNCGISCEYISSEIILNYIAEHGLDNKLGHHSPKKVDYYPKLLSLLDT